MTHDDLCPETSCNSCGHSRVCVAKKDFDKLLFTYTPPFGGRAFLSNLGLNGGANGWEFQRKLYCLLAESCPIYAGEGVSDATRKS